MDTTDEIADAIADERAAKAQPMVWHIAGEFQQHRLATKRCAASRFNPGVWIIRNDANEPTGVLRRTAIGFTLTDEFGEQSVPATK